MARGHGGPDFFRLVDFARSTERTGIVFRSLTSYDRHIIIPVDYERAIRSGAPTARLHGMAEQMKSDNAKDSPSRNNAVR